MAITAGGQRAVVTVRAFFGDEPPVVYRFHAARVEYGHLDVAAGETVVHKFPIPPTTTKPVLVAFRSNVEGVTWQRTVGGAAVLVGGDPAEPAQKLRPWFVSDNLGKLSATNDVGGPLQIEVSFVNATSDDARVDYLYARSN